MIVVISTIKLGFLILFQISRVTLWQGQRQSNQKTAQIAYKICDCVIFYIFYQLRTAFCT